MSAPQDDSEIEEISDPYEKKKKGGKGVMESDEDHRAPRKRGKRKATSDDHDDIQVVEPSKKQKTGGAGSEMKETARARAKPGSRAASKQPAAKASEEKDGGADVAQKNAKKRKINIFPTGNEAIQFSFGAMSNVCFYFPLFHFVFLLRPLFV
jgi:hypothetical protein